MANYKIIPKLSQAPVEKIVIELSANDATHLSFALSMIKEDHYNNPMSLDRWPWLKEFKDDLEIARNGAIVEVLK